MEQPPEQPPEPQPWGGQPWSRPQPPREPPPQQPWGAPPTPRQPWGDRPPEQPKGSRPPGGPPPWYRHPVGMLLIGAAVVIVLALVVPTFTSREPEPAPSLTTGAFGGPSTTAPSASTTTTAGGQPPTAADQLRQAAQAELGGAGEITSATAPPGGPITITWEIAEAGSRGLTENNARFGVMRIMRAVQQTQLSAGGAAPVVRLQGRYQLPGAAAPVTVVRLRFDPVTVERGDFDDRRYLEAFELADAAVIHPAFRG
ncbi:MAG: hypothetical protein ACJ782_24570 [Actinomycetota bacterium]